MPIGRLAWCSGQSAGTCFFVRLFVREVESAGFRLTEEPPLLSQNFFLRFRRLD